MLDPVSWMLLLIEAYSQMGSLLRLFLFVGIQLAHCLSHLFSELLGGAFENTKCTTVTFAI